MLNKYTAYILKTKESRSSYFQHAIFILLMCIALDIPCLTDRCLFINLLGLIVLFFIGVIIHQLYVQCTYEEKEITQEATIVSYEVVDTINLEPTGDERISVFIEFSNGKALNMPMTKREYDALELSKTDNTVIVTARVKITDEDDICPLLFMHDFITVTDIRKAGVNINKSDFV